MKKEFKIKAKVWIYPSPPAGGGGWHFVTLDKKLSSQIREKYKKGFVKVEVKIGKTKWLTSLFPHKLSNAYLLCIKNQVRKKEGILVGDEIGLTIKIL
ncbi:MAG: DUF1905 domain-containing protein [Patescibacteria group bacterium]